MSELTGLIRDLPGQDEEDRGSVRISSCWARTQQPARTAEMFAKNLPQDALLRAADQTPTWNASETLFVAIAFHCPPAVMRAMLDAADAGARVYVLAHSGFADGQQGKELAQRTRSTVFIRRVAHVPVSAMLAERGVQAGVWLGNKSNPAVWWLSLDEIQGKALFQVLIHLFWHDAVDEVWTGTDALHFQPAKARPFDALLPTDKAVIQWLPDRKFENFSNAGILHAPDGVFPASINVQKILTPPSPRQGELVEQVACRTQVVWAELGLPPFILMQNTGIVDCGYDTPKLRIKLTSAQVQEFKLLCDEAINHPEWRFCTDTPLSELPQQLWLANKSKAEKTLDRAILKCGAVTAESLRTMATTKPAHRPKPPQLARCIGYQWVIQPPQVPPTADKDTLVTQWRHLDTTFSKRTGFLRATLERNEGAAGKLGQIFESLKETLQTFGHTRQQLMTQLSQIESKVLSKLGPQQANEYLEHLRELEQKAETLQRSMHKAHQTADDKEQEKKQKEEWNKTKAQAEQEIPKIEARLDEANDELARLKAEMTQVGNISDKKARKDKRKQLNSDKARIERNIKKWKREKETAEAARQYPFKFNPTRPSTLTLQKTLNGATTFAPELDTSIPLKPPREALPLVGHLMYDDNQRYLVIALWEDLEIGENEAQRLHARLVTENNRA